MSGPRRTILVALLVVASGVAVATPGTGDLLTRRGPAPGWVGGPGVGQPVGLLSGGASSAGDAALSSSDLEAIHEAGVTGEGVKVGVIGRQFDGDASPIDEEVVASRQFAGRGLDALTGTGHDTAVAEVVSRTAPDAELYLAGVGSETTPRTYEAAVEWLLAHDVDVIVDAASYFPDSAAAMAEFNAIASRAADQGVVFVTSAGNYANHHWRGTATGDGWVEFADGRTYNALGPGQISGRAVVRLYWSGDADFDLYLYRKRPGRDPLIAKSTTVQTGSGNHSEAIDRTLPPGRYYVAIRGDAANGTDLDLFSATHELGVTAAGGGMVAPATAEDVIAVGALEAGTNRLTKYSSTGGALDISASGAVSTRAAGRLRGSSAAAPVVAGAAALIESQRNVTPEQARRILRRTADRSNGTLRLDVSAAVEAAADQSLSLKAQRRQQTRRWTTADTDDAEGDNESDQDPWGPYRGPK